MVRPRPLPLTAAMSTDARAPFTALDEILCTVLAVGLVLVALLPGARGASAIGWLPMWLVGMPAVAWWAVRGCPVPGRRMQAVESRVAVRVARRIAPQARRRAPARRLTETRRAA